MKLNPLRFFKSLFNNAADAFGVSARRDFGHNAAVERLFFDAGGDDVGDELPPILHNRRRGFVAGGLDT